MKKPIKPFAPVKPAPPTSPEEFFSLWKTISTVDYSGEALPYSSFIEKLEKAAGEIPKDKIVVELTNDYYNYPTISLLTEQQVLNPSYKGQLQNYAKAVDRYENDLEEYRKDYAKYKQDLDSYNEALPKYKAEEKARQIAFHKRELERLNKGG